MCWNDRSSMIGMCPGFVAQLKAAFSPVDRLCTDLPSCGRAQNWPSLGSRGASLRNSALHSKMDTGCSILYNNVAFIY